MFLIVIPLQRKEKILKTLEILRLDLFFQSCKIIRTPKEKILGRDPYSLFKWNNFMVPPGCYQGYSNTAVNTPVLLMVNSKLYY